MAATDFIPGVQYVSQSPTGGYDVYYGGALKGNYGTQSDAENAYNNLFGPTTPTGSSGATTSPTPPASGSPMTSSAGSYQTVNGVKTLADITNELKGAGYNGATDPNSLIAAYARTAGGQVSPYYGGGSAPGGTGVQAGTPTTGLPALTMNDPLRQSLVQIGNAQLASSAGTTAADAYQALAQYQAQQQQTAQQGVTQRQTDSSNQAKSQLITSLMAQLGGQYGPGVLTEINSQLQALGYPAIQGGAGGGPAASPLDMSPGEWASLTPTAKSMILQGLQARGIDTTQWLAALMAQAPQGNATTSQNVHYAPAA